MAFPVIDGREGGSLLVPVLTPQGGDLYRVDSEGMIAWELSMDAWRRKYEIPGFPEGVDMLLWPPDDPTEALVPLQGPDGKGSDLWSVDLATGTILDRARDLNPWMPEFRYVAGLPPDGFLALVEGRDGQPGLILFHTDLRLDATFFDPSIPGFEEWVVPAGGVIPVVNKDATQTDAVFFRGPHPTGGSSLRTDDPDAVLNDYRRGVEPLIVNVGDHLFAPEANRATGEARLEMVEITGTGPQLVIATPGGRAGPGALTAFDAETRLLAWQITDISGLIPGVGMVATRPR